MKTHIHRTLRAGTNCGTRAPARPAATTGWRTNGEEAPRREKNVESRESGKKRGWCAAGSAPVRRKAGARFGGGAYRRRACRPAAQSPARGNCRLTAPPTQRGSAGQMHISGQNENALLYWKRVEVCITFTWGMQQSGAGRGLRRKLSRRRGSRGSLCLPRSAQQSARRLTRKI